MDFKQFTIKSQEAIQKAAELAAASGSPAVETAHLLRSPANARRLLAALNRLDSGEGQSLTTEALAAQSGLG